MFINIGGHLIDTKDGVVMTIINATSDSFYALSRTATKEAIRERASKAIEAGATILDIGGYSSRPGAMDVSLEEETLRVLTAVEVIRDYFGDFPLSIDTFRSDVARAVTTRFGVCAINDISAFEADANMVDTIGELGLPYIMMHMRGTPKNMQDNCQYNNLTEEIIEYFVKKIDFLHRLGIYDLVIDPGFGFSKTRAQNFELMASLGRFRIFEMPILVGISRKSMIYKTLDINPEEALIGTTALHYHCLQEGGNILRVHDTREAVETIRLYREVKKWNLSISESSI